MPVWLEEQLLIIKSANKLWLLVAWGFPGFRFFSSEKAEERWKMKKYGLQLRVPPSQQKKLPTRPPVPTPLGFQGDDEDDVEREIARQATKNKAHRDVSTPWIDFYLHNLPLSSLVLHFLPTDWGAAQKSLGRGPHSFRLWSSLWRYERENCSAFNRRSPGKKGALLFLSFVVLSGGKLKCCMWMSTCTKNKMMKIFVIVVVIKFSQMY